MEEKEFNEKYIAPFYLELMNLNFVKESETKSFELFRQLRELAAELSNEQLMELLNDFWRPSKGGAWMIGLSNRTELYPELEKYLSSKLVHHSEHVLINLLILDKEKAGISITNFIEQQVKHHLESPNIIDLERLSIDWALSILAYLDKSKKSHYITNIYAQDWWMAFMESLKSIRYYESLKERFSPNYQKEKIEKLMQILENENSAT